ncbi:SHOCT domain-containing protein [Halorussus marinus]|uniref:SHOCT domain-containing protein n=1 Tax=Halorussus marinus TaxID=2505976 RepID=UPI00106DE143|nr:SHOCT domain-containing protein [Halorussus marinus]
MGDRSPDTRSGYGEDPDGALETIAVGASMVLMGVLAVALLAAGVSWWWMAFPIGGGLIPLAVGLAQWYRDRGVDESDEQDALDALRARYARGELTEAEFESRLERLLETETPESARASLDREPAADERDRTPERDPEIE